MCWLTRFKVFFAKVKDSTHFKVFIEIWLYLFVFLAMCMCLIAYPCGVDEYIYNFFLAHEIKTGILGYVMELVPLLWISLIGLIAAWFNTFVYCIIDIDPSPKLRCWNIVLSIFAVAIIAYIVFVCCVGYCDFEHKIESGKELSEIRETFHAFSERGTYVTFFTFIFFAFIDYKDIRNSKIKLKINREQKDQDTVKLDLKCSRLQFWLIDIAVLFSSLVLLLFSNRIDYSHLSSGMIEGRFFSNILLAGAWGIQIIISQCVFFIITMLYYIEKVKNEKCVMKERMMKKTRKMRKKKNSYHFYRICSTKSLPCLK